MPPDYAITFFYYDDILAIAPFYEQTLGFELVVDQGLARIYRVGRSYFGIVDGKKGHLRTTPKSAALFCMVTDDVEGWHAKLQAAGVPKLTDIRSATWCDKFFFFEDPAGYALQVQHFRSSEVAALFR
ncbi:bleomycin resistance protein [Falsiroseomonas bella]|uniref:Bleomycin resistance protein n=1 Tax=Falsiroseomonas bella TaxID=2184016 RepID=A0A317FLB7_9PROT|nr:VOC family protein [Falsiroseomonas bella]PWS39162.1 bleomycin resistance protein [Falsiroseomonas bella]